MVYLFRRLLQVICYKRSWDVHGTILRIQITIEIDEVVYLFSQNVPSQNPTPYVCSRVSIYMARVHSMIKSYEYSFTLINVSGHYHDISCHLVVLTPMAIPKYILNGRQGNNFLLNRNAHTDRLIPYGQANQKKKRLQEAHA